MKIKKKKAHEKSACITDAFLVETRGDLPLACQDQTDPNAADLDGLELAQLPVVSVDSRDVLSETIYVGKATVKGLWMEGM